jgi:hypothetical protein
MPISHRHQFLKYPGFVDPLPAEELIKVGLVKQQMFDQNVAKIQEHIGELDQYGFSLVKDVDKQYFSKEMDKFLKAVNESAGKTDFSHMANVRNILSIGRPLENDPYILNAIEGSAELKRRQKYLDSLPAGQRGVSNDWAYMKDAQDWFNDGQVGSKLASGKEYTPYADPSKFVSEAVKNVKPDIRTDVIKKNGYLTTLEIEELTNRRLREYLEENLPSNVVEQIRLDALYQTKDVPEEEMVDYYYNTRYKKLRETEALLQGYQQYKDVLTPRQQAEMQELQLQGQVLLNSLSNPPETKEAAYAAWVNDHYNQFITGQSNFYSYQEVKKKVQADQYDLAAYQSSLRVTAAEEIAKRTLPYKIALQKAKGSGTGGLAPGEGSRGKSLMSKAEIKKSEDASQLFSKLTNGLTNNKDFVKVNVGTLKQQEERELLATLENAADEYGIDPEKIKLDDLYVKKNSDGTYSWRLGGDAGDSEVLQDVFENGFRSVLSLGDLNFDGSIDQVFNRVVEEQNILDEAGIEGGSSDESTSAGGLSTEDIDDIFR